MPRPRKVKSAFDRIVHEVEEVTSEINRRDSELSELRLLKMSLEEVLKMRNQQPKPPAAEARKAA